MRRSTVFASWLLASMLTASVFAPVAAQRTGQRPTDARRTQVLREQVYALLNEAQGCADRGNFGCGFERVATVQAMSDLNSYERAQAWNFLAFLHFQNDDQAAAIKSYEMLLAETDLPHGLKQQSWYSLATLYVSEERYDDGLSALENWWAGADEIAPEAHILRAQIQYQRGDLAAAVRAVDRAIELADERGQQIQEGWFQLKVASLWQLGEVENVAAMLEEIIRRWPQRDYFVQLAGVYGLLDNPTRQLDLYEAAYASGWLQEEAELKSYVGMLMNAGRHTDAAGVFEVNIGRGLIEDTARNRSILRTTAEAAEQ
jgi:tetratricopeptide (TPR) repeat protein